MGKLVRDNNAYFVAASFLGRCWDMPWGALYVSYCVKAMWKFLPCLVIC